jgi:hypothetical protein
MEHEGGTPKLNVWGALTSDFLIGPFIFEEATVTGASYMNTLKIMQSQRYYEAASSSKMEPLNIMPTQ